METAVLVKTLSDAVEQLLESKAGELKIVAEWKDISKIFPLSKKEMPLK